VNLLGSLTVPTVVETRLVPTAPLSSSKSTSYNGPGSPFPGGQLTEPIHTYAIGSG